MSLRSGEKSARTTDPKAALDGFLQPIKGCLPQNILRTAASVHNPAWTAAGATAALVSGGTAAALKVIHGRRVQRAAGEVQAIVEQKDASVEQQQIREGNTGILVAPSSRLRDWLGRLKPA